MRDCAGIVVDNYKIVAVVAAAAKSARDDSMLSDVGDSGVSNVGDLACGVDNARDLNVTSFETGKYVGIGKL